MKASYVEHVITELSQRSSSELQSHFQHLDWILKKIENVPSPEKEALLVRLLTASHVDISNEDQPQSSL